MARGPLGWIASKLPAALAVGALVETMNHADKVVDAGVEAAKAVGKAVEWAGSVTARAESSHGLHRDLIDHEGLKYRIEHATPAAPDMDGPDR